MVDDLGWTDLECFGSDFYETPNVDRLAKKGMKFTNAYASSCVCSPTRVSILTGKYPGRLHITHAIPIQGAERIKEPLPLIEAIYKKNLPLEEFTVAEALKAGGYTTATMGKWHVCWDREFYPKHQGFDFNVGGNNMGNPGNYFFPYNGKWRMTRKHPYTYWNTLPNGKPGEYLTDRLTVEAEQFIEQNKERPFFCTCRIIRCTRRCRRRKSAWQNTKKNRKASGTKMLHTRRWWKAWIALWEGSWRD